MFDYEAQSVPGWAMVRGDGSGALGWRTVLCRDMGRRLRLCIFIPSSVRDGHHYGIR